MLIGAPQNSARAGPAWLLERSCFGGIRKPTPPEAYPLLWCSASEPSLEGSAAVKKLIPRHVQLQQLSTMPPRRFGGRGDPNRDYTLLAGEPEPDVEGKASQVSTRQLFSLAREEAGSLAVASLVLLVASLTQVAFPKLAGAEPKGGRGACQPGKQGAGLHSGCGGECVLSGRRRHGARPCVLQPWRRRVAGHRDRGAALRQHRGAGAAAGQRDSAADHRRRGGGRRGGRGPGLALPVRGRASHVPPEDPPLCGAPPAGERHFLLGEEATLTLFPSELGPLLLSRLPLPHAHTHARTHPFCLALLLCRRWDSTTVSAPGS